MCVSLPRRRGTSLPWGSQWQAAYQWDLQVQCGQAVWHPFHGVSVHEWFHGAEAILRSVRLMFLHVIQSSHVWAPWKECKLKRQALFNSNICFSDIVYHPWKKEEDGNQTREIMYTISLSNPLAPKTATVTETQVVMSSRNMFNYLSSAVLYETLKLHFVDCIRLYTKPVRRVSVTSLMLRSSHTTSPIMTTSTLSTDTCSRGWPRTSVGYGES